MSFEAAYILPHPPLAVPDVGRGQEEGIPDTLAAFEDVSERIARHKPDILIFISPHSAYYGDWIYVAAGRKARGSFADFGAAHVGFTLNYDEDYRGDLIAAAQKRHIPAGMVSRFSQDLDHGIIIPLYFIDQHLSPASYKAVSVGGSGLTSEQLLDFGSCIAEVSEVRDERVVLIVSGDLSHKLIPDGPYGFDPAGPIFDALFQEIINQNTPLEFAHIDPDVREAAAECGLSGFIMCAGALDALKKSGLDFSAELLSYEGPYGVGYGVAAFEKRKG